MAVINDPISVGCPQCQALKGKNCITPDGRYRTPHASRVRRSKILSVKDELVRVEDLTPGEFFSRDTGDLVYVCVSTTSNSFSQGVRGLEQCLAIKAFSMNGHLVSFNYGKKVVRKDFLSFVNSAASFDPSARDILAALLQSSVSPAIPNQPRPGGYRSDPVGEGWSLVGNVEVRGSLPYYPKGRELLDDHSRIVDVGLRRDPENKFDKNAIMFVAYPVDYVTDGVKLGYVPRETAAAIAEVYDTGVETQVSLISGSNSRLRVWIRDFGAVDRRKTKR